MPHLCVLPSQPNSMCSSRWQNTLICLNWYTSDISIILLFTFYQPVFHATQDQHFPFESEDMAPYWEGFREHCGDAMTHKLLDHDTQKIIYRSAVRPQKSTSPNHRHAPHGERFLHLLTLLEIKFISITIWTFRGLLLKQVTPETEDPTVFIRY